MGEMEIINELVTSLTQLDDLLIHISNSTKSKKTMNSNMKEIVLSRSYVKLIREYALQAIAKSSSQEK